MARRDFSQQEWNERLADDAKRLIAETLAEDLESAGDLTSLALVADDVFGKAAVSARQAGVVAGLETAPLVLAAVDSLLEWRPKKKDGDRLEPGDVLGVISGPVRTMLTAERPLLNIVGRLSGIASLTAQYVERIIGTGAHLYDTRKTTPGWRRLEKYAVHCGGGRNHRTGLFDAMLIKDNHLACVDGEGLSPAEAVRRGREWLQSRFPDAPLPLIEVEVDSLEQLENVLPAAPNIVLLDNMPPATLREAVALRNKIAPSVELEASGGVTLETVRAKAESGVERISVGRLTHSPQTLDIGLDWAGEAAQ